MQRNAVDHLWRLEGRDGPAHLTSTQNFSGGESVTTINREDVLHPASRLKHHCNLDLDKDSIYCNQHINLSYNNTRSSVARETSPTSETSQDITRPGSDELCWQLPSLGKLEAYLGTEAVGSISAAVGITGIIMRRKFVLSAVLRDSGLFCRVSRASHECLMWAT